MRYYETVVIIHPALEGGLLKDNIVEIQKLAEQKGGDLKNTEVWGRKKLAYLIDKQKYGTYTMLQFTGDGVKINEMNVELEHNPNVLAYMTIKINKTEMKEQTADLDTQIDGQSSSSPEADEVNIAVATEIEEEIPDVGVKYIQKILEEEDEDIVVGNELEAKLSDDPEAEEDKEN